MLVKPVSLHLRRPVSIRPISTRSWSQMSGDRRFTHRSAMANYLYIIRDAGQDAHGAVDYRHRDDLVAQGLELPAQHPAWAETPGRIWQDIDRLAPDRSADAITCWHVVVTLPETDDCACWAAMVQDYARDTIARHGPAVAWAIHARDATPGQAEVSPHAHLLTTVRQWKHGDGQGRTVPGWCGPAMRARLHADWLARLPAAMRLSATTPYRAGAYQAARPDCSALAGLFGQAGWLGRP